LKKEMSQPRLQLELALRRKPEGAQLLWRRTLALRIICDQALRGAPAVRLVARGVDAFLTRTAPAQSRWPPTASACGAWQPTSRSTGCRASAACCCRTTGALGLPSLVRLARGRCLGAREPRSRRSAPYVTRAGWHGACACAADAAGGARARVGRLFAAR